MLCSAPNLSLSFVEQTFQLSVAVLSSNQSLYTSTGQPVGYTYNLPATVKAAGLQHVIHMTIRVNMSATCTGAWLVKPTTMTGAVLHFAIKRQGVCPYCTGNWSAAVPWT